MSRARALAVVLLVSFAAHLLGCVAWRSQVDPLAELYEPRDAGRQRLQVTLSVEHPGATQDFLAKATEDIEAMALEVLQESGRFSLVGTRVPDPELELVLNVVQEERFAEWNLLLSALTATVVPFYERIGVEATGGLYDASGEKLHDIQVEQDLGLILSVLLFPGTPFVPGVVREMRRDLFRSAVVQMDRASLR